MSISSIGEARPSHAPAPAVEARSPPTPTSAPSAARPHTRPSTGEPGSGAAVSPFAALVHGLGHEVQRGEALMRGALDARGGDLGPAELIALQAGVYRYSEAVDLAAKL